VRLLVRDYNQPVVRQPIDLGHGRSPFGSSEVTEIIQRRQAQPGVRVEPVFFNVGQRAKKKPGGTVAARFPTPTASSGDRGIGDAVRKRISL